MNTIEFKVVGATVDSWEYGPEVQISIDGRILIDLVREAEMPYATAMGHPEIAGRYRGTPAELLHSRHFFGEPTGVYKILGRDILLLCTCGEPGCWPFVASIQLEPARVTWNDFRQPHAKDWKYEPLGEFVFDRRQYESALEQAATTARDAQNSVVPQPEDRYFRDDGTPRLDLQLSLGAPPIPGRQPWDRDLPWYVGIQVRNRRTLPVLVKEVGLRTEDGERIPFPPDALLGFTPLDTDISPGETAYFHVYTSILPREIFARPLVGYVRLPSEDMVETEPTQLHHP